MTITGGLSSGMIMCLNLTQIDNDNYLYSKLNTGTVAGEVKTILHKSAVTPGSECNQPASSRAHLYRGLPTTAGPTQAPTTASQQGGGNQGGAQTSSQQGGGNQGGAQT